MSTNDVASWNTDYRLNRDIGDELLNDNNDRDRKMRKMMAQIKTEFDSIGTTISGLLVTVATPDDITGYTPAAGLTTIWVLGYAGAPIAPHLWVKSASEPTHSLKRQAADGSWWTLPEGVTDLRHLGPVVNGEAIDTAIDNAWEYCQYWKNAEIDIPAGVFYIDETHEVTYTTNRNGVHLRGAGIGVTYIGVRVATGAFTTDTSDPAAGRNFIIMHDFSIFPRLPDNSAVAHFWKHTGQGNGSSIQHTVDIYNVSETSDIDNLTGGSVFTRTFDWTKADRPRAVNIRGHGRLGPGTTASDWFLSDNLIYMYDCYGGFLENVRGWSKEQVFDITQVTHEGLTLINCGSGGNCLRTGVVDGGNRSVGPFSRLYSDAYEHGWRITDTKNLNVDVYMGWHPDAYDDDGGAMPEPAEFRDLVLDNCDRTIVTGGIHRFENSGVVSRIGVSIGASSDSIKLFNIDVRYRTRGILNTGNGTYMENIFGEDISDTIVFNHSASVNAKIVRVHKGANCNARIIDNSTTAHIEHAEPIEVTVKLDGSQVIATGTTLADIAFDAIVGSDPFGMATLGDRSLGTAGTITIPDDEGVQYVEVEIKSMWDSNGTGGREIVVKKNGTLFDRSPHDMRPSYTYARCAMSVTGIPVNDGDVFKAQCAQSSGGNLNLRSETLMTVRAVSKVA